MKQKTSATSKSPSHNLNPRLKRAVNLVLRLMAIPGKSGDEKAVATFIKHKLLASGAPASAIRMDKTHKFTSLPNGNSGNLVLKLPGTLKQPRRMFSAHMDTVPICVGTRPVRKGNIVRSGRAGTGLGADDRAGCAVVLNTALEILERKVPHPPLTFCWFAQEEIGVQGSKFADKTLWGDPKVAFNFDGGSPAKLTIGATGAYRIAIEVKGIPSHAGITPEQGVSAITIAAIAIAELQQGGWLGAIRKGNEKGTSNIGFIEGGEVTNVVTDLVVLKAEARSHNSKFRRRILSEMKKAFENAAKKVTNIDKKRGKISFKPHLNYDSFLLETTHPAVRMAQLAVEAAGKKPELAISSGGVDANWVNRHGVPMISFGCGQRGQHMAFESLNVREYEVACEMALNLATATD